MKGNKSIGALISSSIAILISSITVGVLLYYFASNAIAANISKSLTEIAYLGAKAVENNLEGSLEVNEAIAARTSIKDPNISIENKVAILWGEVKRLGITRLSISDMNGNALTTDGIRLNIGDREYFKIAKEGQKNISDPIVSKISNKLVVTFAVPIKNNDKVIGVLYSTQEIESLSNITDSIQYGDNGTSFIIDGKGTIIAHQDRSLVKDGVNPILDDERLGFDASVYNFFASMRNNESGSGRYIYNGIKKYASYTKIKNTNWYFAITAPQSQVFSGMNQIIYFVLSLIVLSIVIFLVSNFYIRYLRNNLENERNSANEKIYRLAYYDPLTGLANRNNMESYFNKNIVNKKNKAALFFMDLDNFKFINDTFGHAVGDELLVQVGSYIESAIENGIVARNGGDEFVVILNEYAKIEEVYLFADKLLKTLQTEFYLEGISINISTSIGIALYPTDGKNFIDLLKCADTALYAAKDAGKRSFAFFNQDMNDDVVKRMKLESTMIKAIENNEFILHFQPQYKIGSREIRGFEALIRWNSPEHGFISPVEFISIAESSGLIVPLGEWVIREACDFAKKIIAKGNKDIIISVNVSVIQLMQENFVAKVQSIIKEKQLDPSYLELEITESILLENMNLNIEKIKELRKLGIKISLDDFGTGFSSLTYLSELPINVLKIDKSFIDKILSTDDKRGLAGSIISLAHDLGLEVVAEGVEEQEQLRYLEIYHCDMIQGYLLGKPMPIEMAMKLIV